ncbi:TPA: helix-turn-helix domain-containing protein [Candidatus Woesearchaeota archaeon]|nr:helix-turn-helix domain-containing protein [Candidatus Woesearchaeota archaeon]HIH12870.1 helix-turn-helix domain-containing protein [Candidatus Woesearchaeota archaeon]
MSPLSLEDIRRLRKKYHLTQKQLADRSGVSQSLLAKIEAQRVEPTYSKAQAIFAALDSLREKQELKAKELLNQKVSFAHGQDSLIEVIKVMKLKGISQMPVLVNERVCGLISETAIVNALIDHPARLQALKVSDVMEDAPPIVSLHAGLRTVTELLRDAPIVLVAEKGNIKGLISKTDLLGKME